MFILIMSLVCDTFDLRPHTGLLSASNTSHG
nr:MAG TPA: hypothetical protein [Caudoviricetes sp.]DAH49672.1 MAG TPA: hypothetical protein [Caudoviricetes sp.]